MADGQILFTTHSHHPKTTELTFQSETKAAFLSLLLHTLEVAAVQFACYCSDRKRGSVWSSGCLLASCLQAYMKDANIRPKHLDLIQQLMKLLVKEGEKYSEEEGGKLRKRNTHYF